MKKVKIKAIYLRLSEEVNAFDYLEQAYRYICQTDTNAIAWKWVVIALHGALYGFAICDIKGTNPDNVTFNGDKRLISFDEALKRCQKSNQMKMTRMSKYLQLSVQQKESIRQLKNTLRNNFEHYKPRGWSIEIHGMPQIAIDVLEVIRFLALDTGNYVNLTKTQKKRVKSIFFQSKQILKQSQLYKEAKLV